MILEYDESKGGGEKGRQKSFYYIQEHDHKSVGNHNNPKKNNICTEEKMKVVDRKADLSFYNLTHQTCSVKSKNCIFVAGNFSQCKDWSRIPYKHIWYCNMCAIRKGTTEVNVNITTMCGCCKTICQEDEDRSTPKTVHSRKRPKPRLLGNI